DDFYRLVVNAGTREKDLAWMKKHIGQFNIVLTDRTDLAMLAVQGPAVTAKLAAFLPPAYATAVQQLKPFTFVELNEWCIARTGYTGEDGFEIIVPAKNAPLIWAGLMSAGIAPCGLGARDTLRLEAGFNLYGSDMGESVSPLESNLTWTVAF